MKVYSILPLLFVLCTAHSLFGQSAESLAKALQTALGQPEVEEALQTYWPEGTAFYLRADEGQSQLKSSFSQAFAALQPGDVETPQGRGFNSLFPGEESQLPAESRDWGIIDLGGTFRSDVLSLHFFATLPGGRQQMLGSYVLRQSGGSWAIEQQQFSIR